MPTACSLRKHPESRRDLAARWQLSLAAVQLFFIVSMAVVVPARLLAQPTIPPDQDALLKGLGMGLATIADVNNYPGPKHVINLKTELNLTRDQLKKTEALDKVVSSSAVAKGGEIVLAEEELYRSFEAGTISEKALRLQLEQISKLRADLRFIHLQAHLRMKQILTPDQIKKYNEIRGRENKPEN
jgi:Spy/CpxP family protein refolding chaperone